MTHDYIEEYKKLYKENYNNNINYNVTMMNFKLIEKYSKMYNVKSLFDYGCGQGIQYTEGKIHKKLNISNLTLYDPVIEEFNKKPNINNKFDMLICIDVMEHIPENEVDSILCDIFKYKFNIAIFSISTVLARTLLSNGENVHLTVKPISWWTKKILKYNTYNIPTVINTGMLISSLNQKKNKNI